MKVFGTPMNADATPMNADMAVCIEVALDSLASSAMSITGGELLAMISSAFIGVASAFIGVPKTLAPASH